MSLKSASRNMLEDNLFDSPLQADLKLLGDVLLEIIEECKTSTPQVAQFLNNAISKIISTSEEYTKTHSEEIFQTLVSQTTHLSHEEAKATAKAFQEYLDLANIAERVHRVRRWKQYKQGKGNIILKQTIKDCFEKLLAKGFSVEKIRETIINQNIELVLTAHPTQGY